MVDAVVRAWLVEATGSMDILDVRQLLACFYADDGLIVARDPVQLQCAFDSLYALFDRVGLKTNTKKTELLVLLPGRIRTCLNADAYKARMSNLYREERRGRRVSCPECGKGMAVGSLRSHLETQHDVYTSFALPTDAAPPAAPRRLEAAYDLMEGKYRCPVPGCPQGTEGRGCRTPFNLQWHFRYRHPRNEVVIRGQCLPQCRRCGMQVSWSTIGSPAHENSKTCRRMAEQRHQHRVVAEGLRAAAQRFTAYGTDELRNVTRFRYLGRVLSHNDSDIPAMRQNLQKARATWGRLSKVLRRQEVPPPVAGMFYQAAVAAVLLYGSESWNLPPSGIKVLEGFHVESARRLTGIRPQRQTVGPWVFPKSEDVLRVARLKTISHYIRSR